MMRIALPIENGILCGHFGHAPQFGFVDVEDNGKIARSWLDNPPPHEPGSLPAWLKQQQVTHIICGGIGARAVELLNQAGIQVIAGIPSGDPSRVVEEFLAGNLKGATGATCSGHEHGEGHQCAHH